MHAMRRMINTVSRLAEAVEPKTPQELKFKVVFGWKQHRYDPLVGDAYVVTATSEKHAKTQVRKMLRDRFPYDSTWRVLYATELAS